jgi:hypothetical protein
MKNFSIYILTTALLALFAGGSIIVLFILIPFWQTLEPNALMEWFQHFGSQMGFVMLPMEMIPLLLSVYVWFIARKTNEEGKNLWLCVNVCNAIVLLMLFLYFIPVNLSFIHKIMLPENVAGELVRWKMIHAMRTIFILLSMVLAIFAVGRRVGKGVGN